MTPEEIEAQNRADHLVDTAVHQCLSMLVWQLAEGYGKQLPEPLSDLVEQAFKLSCPVQDYEEAAIQAGWKPFASHGNIWSRKIRENEDADEGPLMYADGPEEACQIDGLDPYEWEISEHWVVSEWLGRKLADKDQRVDFDFAGMVVWGRTYTGQAISMDSVIREIAREEIDAT